MSLPVPQSWCHAVKTQKPFLWTLTELAGRLRHLFREMILNFGNDSSSAIQYHLLGWSFNWIIALISSSWWKSCFIWWSLTYKTNQISFQPKQTLPAVHCVFLYPLLPVRIQLLGLRVQIFVWFLLFLCLFLFCFPPVLLENHCDLNLKQHARNNNIELLIPLIRLDVLVSHRSLVVPTMTRFFTSPASFWGTSSIVQSNESISILLILCNI